MAQDAKKRLDAAHFSPDTLEFIHLLEKHVVRYVIVGGEAVIFHGYARFTGDVDFFYSLDSENAEKLFAALKEFWEGAVPGIASAAELREPCSVVQFGRPPNRIDLLNSIDGVSFEDAWQTREIVAIESVDSSLQTSFLSLSKLVQNKRASGRPKDLDDLTFLNKMASDQGTKPSAEKPR